MQRVALRDVDLASFKASVGADGFADGTAAVTRGAVVQMAWEASQQLLTGTVRDSGGEIRTVSASFRASHGFPLRFKQGYCSCAAGANCVHVAALVLAATDDTLLPATASAGGAAHRGRPPVTAAVGAVARFAARHPAGDRAGDGRRRFRARAARGRALPGAE